MPGRFDHLLAPGRIGPLEVRNRIAMCPIGDTLGEDGGFVSDRQTAYYAARARGGAGLIIAGSVAVGYPAGTYHRAQLGLSSDEFLPGLRRLTSAVHRHGAAIAAQLVHDGPNSLNDIAAGRPLLLPSPPGRPTSDPLAAMVTADELTEMTAPFTQPGARLDLRVAEEDDLAVAVEQFASAALRAQEAGFDGVEIHAGHGYLIDAFLSPATNRRTDAWGGSLDNRARLLCSVVRAVRARVGDRFAVWCRFNGEERHRTGGLTAAEGLGVARLTVEAGVDALHVSAYADPGVAIGITDAHTPHTPGALVGLAADVKAAVPVPVITFGRLEPDDAERVVATGQADFVAFGRKLLADPDLPAKLAADRVDDVRPCIYAYRCIGNIFLGRSVGCVAAPATGRDDDAHVLPVVATGAIRRILVVGGGPAGLETARLLAGAGHEVTLWEMRHRLGGRLALAARTDETLDRFLGWLVGSVERAGVELVLGVTASAEDVVASSPDDVVVAAGATWPVDRWSAWFDDDSAAVGDRVAVLGADVPGLGVAALAAARGRSVTVHDTSAVAGEQLGLPGRFRRVHDLREAGVVFSLGGPIRVIEGVDADTVIDTRPSPADGWLVQSLADAACDATVHVVGDRRSIGFIEGAMRSAWETALAISPAVSPPA